ncbi:MAG: tetratricopeptide repeat protein, partial [Treponema sp.]|nr:tetratricopeptide repeat protein [Treponema sp.]
MQKRVFIVWYALAFSLIITVHAAADDNAARFLDRGISFANKGDYDTAIADFNDAIRLNPNLASAYYQRAYAYHFKEEYDQAIADYT